MKTNQLLSVSEAAKLLHLSAVRVRQFCREGRLESVRVANNYVVPRWAVTQFAKLPRKNGRPRNLKKSEKTC